MVEPSALASGEGVEDEGHSGFHAELLNEKGGPLAEIQTGRGTGWRTETKIFVYLLNKCLLSPCYVQDAVPSLRDTAANKLG